MHQGYNQNLDKIARVANALVDPDRSDNAMWGGLAEQANLQLTGPSEPVSQRSANPPQPNRTVRAVQTPQTQGQPVAPNQAPVEEPINHQKLEEIAANGQAIAGAWGDRAKTIAPLLLSDSLRWVGVLLPTLIAFPGVKSQIPVLYFGVLPALAIAGYLSQKHWMTRNGVVGFFVLKGTEDFIKAFVVIKLAAAPLY